VIDFFFGLTNKLSQMNSLLRLSKNLILTYFIVSAVSCTKSNSKLGNNPVSEDVAIDTASVEQVKRPRPDISENTLNLEKVLPVLSDETQRFTDDNGYLHIDISAAKIPMGKQERLIRKLFPDGEVIYTAPNEFYDAFNVDFENNKYSAVFTFEHTEKAVYLGFIIVMKGEFDEENLMDLFQ
jgi:hypothetical protein